MSDTIEQTVTDWCPVYEKDGNEFVVLAPTFRADSAEEAWRIGMDSMFVACVLWQMKYKRVIGVNSANMPHRAATIEGCPIAIISGPYFDDAEGMV